MKVLEWGCNGPGEWWAGPYVARRCRSSKNSWEVRYQGESLWSNLYSLEDAKRAAQAHADRLVADARDDIPVASVTRVEVIDHRMGATFRGRAYTAHDVKRVVLSLQDDKQTLKVMIA